ncbi:hypothetical protein CC79DRAFT_185665 [Sarocladium strictum]
MSSGQNSRERHPCRIPRAYAPTNKTVPAAPLSTIAKWELQPLSTDDKVHDRRDGCVGADQVDTKLEVRRCFWPPCLSTTGLHAGTPGQVSGWFLCLCRLMLGGLIRGMSAGTLAPLVPSHRAARMMALPLGLVHSSTPQSLSPDLTWCGLLQPPGSLSSFGRRIQD